MKKIDYFLTSLILTLTFVGFFSALLIAEFNSSRYISASTQRLIEVNIESKLKGEITLLGEKAEWDFSNYEEDFSKIKKAEIVLPRKVRIVGKTLSIMYDEIKALFEGLQ